MIDSSPNQQQYLDEKQYLDEEGLVHNEPNASPSVPSRLRDSGMATAEYAIATLAACGFAALLVVILSSDEVRSTLLGVIRGALALGG